MTFRNVFFFSTFFLMSIFLNAQSQNWVTFTAEFNKKNGVVDVNVVLRKRTSIKTQPYLIKVAVRMNNPTREGLASDEEMPILLAFSDSVKSVLGKTVVFDMAGNLTNNGIRSTYFYASDTIGLRQKFKSMYAESFPNYTLGLNLDYEKDWESYFDLLYPGDDIIELIQKSRYFR